MKHAYRAVPILFLALLLQGCTATVTPPDPGVAALQSVQKNLGIAGKSIGIIQTAVLAAGDQKLIPDSVVRKIMDACNDGNLVGKQADAILRTLATLTPGAKIQLLNILEPFIKSLGTLINQGVGNITDPTTKTNIVTLLTALQTTLSGIHLAISATGGA